MLFYSSGNSHYCHRVRIVLAEKGINADILEVDLNNKPADLVDINPYQEVPTLVDRDLALYEPNIMMEYLDERFPHPPLLPVYPVARANSRLLMYRVERDWCRLANQLLAAKEKTAVLNKARQELKDSLTSVATVFNEKPFFLSDEFSLVDCCIAPVLWRLPSLGIELVSNQTKPLQEYMARLFTRNSFQASLSLAEREIRPNYLEQISI
jgi:RNA polymerase-associated protein